MPVAGALTAAAGYVGKMPARGDFVRAGLPAAFAQHWDAWLAVGMADAATRLGDGFDAAYMAAPVWRFALAPSVSGPDPAAGLLLPSVDRVGRRFPLTIAAAMPGCDPAGLAACADWYDTIEAAARGAVEADLTPDGLDQMLAEAGLPQPGLVPGRALLPEDGRLDVAWPALARLIAHPDLSLWWTAGSPHLPAQAIACRGLPDFADLVAGP